MVPSNLPFRVGSQPASVFSARPFFTALSGRLMHHGCCRLRLRPGLCCVESDSPQWNSSFMLISRPEQSRANVWAMFRLSEEL